jgi:hypothetical protein
MNVTIDNSSSQDSSNMGFVTGAKAEDLSENKRVILIKLKEHTVLNLKAAGDWSKNGTIYGLTSLGSNDYTNGFLIDAVNIKIIILKGSKVDKVYGLYSPIEGAGGQDNLTWIKFLHSKFEMEAGSETNEAVGIYIEDNKERPLKSYIYMVGSKFILRSSTKPLACEDGQCSNNIGGFNWSDDAFELITT